MSLKDKTKSRPKTAFLPVALFKTLIRIPRLHTPNLFGSSGSGKGHVQHDIRNVDAPPFLVARVYNTLFKKASPFFMITQIYFSV
jgi:hypothetical protein